MSKAITRLTVTLRAEWAGEDFMPDDAAAEEVISLEFPFMDEKFVVFPKMMEGATFSVIASHRARVREEWARQEDEKRAAAEVQKMKLFEDGGR